MSASKPKKDFWWVFAFPEGTFKLSPEMIEVLQDRSTAEGSQTQIHRDIEKILKNGLSLLNDTDEDYATIVQHVIDELAKLFDT